MDYYFNIKTKMKNIILIVIIFLLIAGCGYYSFSGSSLPPHLKTVAIPVFDDNTAEFGVRESITEQLIEEFTKDNSLKISDSRNSDSIIEGTITNIRDQAGAYGTDESVQDIKVYVTVDVKFRDLKKRKIIWEERLTQWGTYIPSQENREDGITAAIDKLVDDIFNKSIAGW